MLPADRAPGRRGACPVKPQALLRELNMTSPTRRQLALAAAVLCLVPFAVLVGVEGYFFTHMPDSPSPTTGQVLGVPVNHRTVYVTSGQFEFLFSVIRICLPLITVGAVVLAAVYVHFRATRNTA